jgi:four helix bundle protein
MSDSEQLPHHRLVAFQIAREMLRAVAAARIKDAKLRDQALRAAKSVCLNVAEASGRRSAVDRVRVFAIARGEACEAAAAVEIGAVAGDCSVSSSDAVNALAHRLVGLLSGLSRTDP